MFFFLNFDPYIAIIGDIKKSKNIANRKEIQDKLKNVLKEINIKYENDIAAKFMITLGDEFQGLLNNGSAVMNIISEIERKMYPTEIRFGIGVGEITTDIDIEMAIGADGPGYYKAREAIEYLKDSEKKQKAIITDTRIEIDGNNQVATNLINTVLSLISAIKESWTDRQREIISDMLEHQDSQINVANRLNIGQSAAQKSLAGGKYYTYKEALDTITCTLAEIRRENV
ncbi:MAG: SatD family protein [Herbinix sp.]|nr:SatD family protein [Herbinix sp.]